MMKLFAFTLLFLVSILVVSGQDLTTLNKDLRQRQAAIEKLEKDLNANRELQKDKLTQKRLLDQKVKAREELVKQLNSRISILKGDMGDLSGVVSRHNRRFDSLNIVRNSLLKKAYIKADFANFGTLKDEFSVELDIVDRMLKNEASNVDSMKRVLGERYEKLMRQSKELAELSQSRKNELAAMDSERKQLEQLNLQLKSQEVVIKQSADSERIKIVNLQNQIAAFVKIEAKTRGEVNALGGEFGQNKGKLPSPLLFYVVEDKYGVHEHPTQKGIKIQNNGVNLKATMDLSVNVVFDGEVRGVFLVEGMGSSVLVRHGDYFTVYSNLAQVKVLKGESVKAGQVVGQLSEKNRVLHFEIWNSTKTVNPQQWIYSK